MQIEDQVLSRLEAVLAEAEGNKDNHNGSGGGTPTPFGLYERERNLYHQLINLYRTSGNEAKRQLQDTLRLLAAFHGIIETIKRNENFQEICSRVVDFSLRDLGAEYCSILLFKEEDSTEDPFCLEGVQEKTSFLRIHSGGRLLGSVQFEETVTRLSRESGECLNVGDVCLDARFDDVDFPSVVRSFVSLPIVLNRAAVGFLILSHSRPHSFDNSKILFLKILATSLAHAHLTTSAHTRETSDFVRPIAAPRFAREDRDVLSIIVLDFEVVGPLGQTTSLRRDTLRQIRDNLRAILEGKESVLVQENGELLVLLPGVSGEQLFCRVRHLRDAFQQWKIRQNRELHQVRLSIGFSACEQGQNLAEALEVAALMMHPELDEELSVPA